MGDLRATQTFLEVWVQMPSDLRATQTTAEVWAGDYPPEARVSTFVAEAFIREGSFVQVSHLFYELWIAVPSGVRLLNVSAQVI